MSNEVWSNEPIELEIAVLNAEGRVFKTRGGDIVDDVQTRPSDRSCTDKFPAYSEATGWYYKTDGRLYDHRESEHDLVSVKVEAKQPGQEVPVETHDNPDFLRLLSFAKDEESTDIIRREYAGYRLLESLHLRVLGHTGKRKVVTWESAAKLRALLDVDRMCDSVPWIISEGEDIHEVFEEHRPGSCMRDSCKHELRQLYALNPDKVKTAHHAKGSHGLLQSSISCLVWYATDKVYIDRRYTDGYLPNTKEPLIRSLARQLKTVTGKDVALVWKGDDIAGIDTISSAIQFKLNRDSDSMPWCDSVRYVVDYDDETVTLSTSESGGRLCCQDQSGTDITESPCNCCSCNCSIDEDDSRTDHNGNQYCDSCYSDAYAYCNWNEEDYSVDEVNEVRVYSYGSRYQHRRYSRLTGYGWPASIPSWSIMYISDQALSDDFTELQNGTYCHNDLVVEDNRGNYYAPDGDSNYAVTEDNDIYHPDDAVQCLDDTIQPKEDCTELHDGTWCLSEYAVEVNGEWYHEDSLPDGYEIDKLPMCPSPLPEVSSEKEETEDYPIGEFRLLQVGETIQEGDWCIGWRENSRDQWFRTGDPGDIVSDGGLAYMRAIETTVTSEVQ